MGERKDIVLGIDLRPETTQREAAEAFDPMAPQTGNATDNRDAYEFDTKDWYPEHFISFKMPHLMSLGRGTFPGGREN